jgi:Mg-chelatase subunit ChlD
MMLYQPVWLFLVIPLAVSLWVWRFPSRWLLVLRLIALTLLLLALCGVAIKLPSRAGTIVVVADRSQSMPHDSEAAEKEAIDLIQAAMVAEDRLAVVSFGQTTAIEQSPQAGKFAGFVNEVGRDASNLAEAVEAALALIPKDAPGKVLVLSDGRWTGRNPAAAAARATARGIAIDYRLLQRPTAQDVAIASVDAAGTVAQGESFMITAWVHAPTAQELSFELRRGTQRLAAGKQQFASGLNRLTFRDQAAEPGTQAYALVVTGSSTDPVPENNTARLLVGVQGPRPILYVTESPGSGLPRLLEAGGLRIKAQSPEALEWSLEELSKYSAVVVENVPAEKIGGTGMETLAAWVRETGAGLMTTGGRNAYGPGGYYRSPLEPILPVSMELRNEHRKLALAIVVALDRSGSMAVPVGGGRTKMDLANLGTTQVLDLLGPMDEFGVVAVDSQPHTIAELAQVKDKASVRNDILRIQSMGGGIFVYEALAAASKMLMAAKAGTRHIILFSDAADSEEPGKYQELLEACRQAQITVSVIGLGTPADQDAELLRDIARRGQGRIFFTDKPEELPRLFAQDTFVVARSTFLDEPTPIRTTPGLSALTGKQFGTPPAIGGYNLCYLRPGATLATVTLDEYKAPVVAAWQAGIGRVLCYTGEADGKYTGAIAGWKEVGDYLTSLARWTAGQSGPLPDNILVTQEVRNGTNIVQLHLDPERKGEPFTGLPRVTTLRGVSGQKPVAQKAAMHWSSADTLTLETPLQGNETVLTTVEVPGQQPLMLSPVCLPYSPEFKPVQGDVGLMTLDHLARATGGKERVNLAGIWTELPKHPRMLPIGHWLVILAIMVLLLEILERRTGLLTQGGQLVWQATQRPTPRRGWRFWHRPSRTTEAIPTPQPAVAAPQTREPAQPAPAASGQPKAGMLDALHKARQRGRERTER